jgi:holin-like protein
MLPRKLSIPLRRALDRSRPLQVGVLCLFWLAGEALVRWARLPVPGGVVGMLIVLALLASRWLKPTVVRRGSEWFIGEMLLFFVPAVLVLLDHHEFLGWLGLKVLAVIAFGTVAVMVVTGVVVELCFRWMSRHVVE